jgi:PAS domain S-box-containing protein
LGTRLGTIARSQCVRRGLHSGIPCKSCGAILDALRTLSCEFAAEIDKSHSIDGRRRPTAEDVAIASDFGLILDIGDQPLRPSALSSLSATVASWIAEVRQIAEPQYPYKPNDLLECLPAELRDCVPSDFLQFIDVNQSLGNLGIALTDERANFLFVNDAYCNIAGHKKSELLSENIWQISHPDDVPITKQLLGEMIEGKRVGFSLPKRYIRFDGSLSWGCTRVSKLGTTNKRSLLCGIVIPIEDGEFGFGDQQRYRRLRERISGASHKLANTIQTLQFLVEPNPPEGKLDFSIEEQIENMRLVLRQLTNNLGEDTSNVA